MKRKKYAFVIIAIFVIAAIYLSSMIIKKPTNVSYGIGIPYDEPEESEEYDTFLYNLNASNIYKRGYLKKFRFYQYTKNNLNCKHNIKFKTIKKKILKHIYSTGNNDFKNSKKIYLSKIAVFAWNINMNCFVKSPKVFIFSENLKSFILADVIYNSDEKNIFEVQINNDIYENYFLQERVKNNTQKYIMCYNAGELGLLDSDNNYYSLNHKIKSVKGDYYHSLDYNSLSFSFDMLSDKKNLVKVDGFKNANVKSVNLIRQKKKVNVFCCDQSYNDKLAPSLKKSGWKINKLNNYSDFVYKGENNIMFIPLKSATQIYNLSDEKIVSIGAFTSFVPEAISVNENINSIQKFNKKTIYVKRDNCIDEYIIRCLCDKNDITDYHIMKYDSLKTISNKVLNDKNSVLIANNNESKIIKKEKMNNVLSLQEEWNMISNDSSIISYIVLANHSFCDENYDVIKLLYDDLKNMYGEYYIIGNKMTYSLIEYINYLYAYNTNIWGNYKPDDRFCYVL